MVFDFNQVAHYKYMVGWTHAVHKVGIPHKSSVKLLFNLMWLIMYIPLIHCFAFLHNMYTYLSVKKASQLGYWGDSPQDFNLLLCVGFMQDIKKTIVMRRACKLTTIEPAMLNH